MKKAWMLVFLLTIPLVAHAQGSSGQEGAKVNASPLGGGAGPPSGPIVCGYFNGDTTYRCLHLDTDGNLKTTDADRDRNKIFSKLIIGPTLLTSGLADSNSTPETALSYRHWKLLIKAVNSGGVGTVCRLAVQIRSHLTAASPDSASTFAEYQLAQMPIQAAGALDTLLAGHIATGSATAPWSGEFTVDVATNRNAPGSATAAVLFSYPNGISIPLDQVFGRDFWAPYLSVRIRNMVGPSCTVTAWLVASPL